VKSPAPTYPGNTGALDPAGLLNGAKSPLCGAIFYVKISLLFPTNGAIVQKSQTHNVVQNQYISRIFGCPLFYCKIIKGNISAILSNTLKNQKSNLHFKKTNKKIRYISAWPGWKWLQLEKVGPTFQCLDKIEENQSWFADSSS